MKKALPLILAAVYGLSGCLDLGSESSSVNDMEVKASTEPVDVTKMKVDVVANTEKPAEVEAVIQQDDTGITLESLGSRTVNASDQPNPLKTAKLASSELSESSNPQSRILVPGYTPGCFTFGINQFIALPATPGASYCIYYEITEESRTSFFVLDQTTTAQFNVLVNHDIQGNYGLSYVAQGNAGGPVVFTEPGHYYAFYTVANTAPTSETLRIGVAVNTDVDAYENANSVNSYVGNDSPNSPYQVENGTLKYYSANIDNPADIDYYRIPTVWAQDLVFAIRTYGGDHPNPAVGIAEAAVALRVQVSFGGGWFDWQTNELATVGNFDPNTTGGSILVRVFPTTSDITYNNYALYAGSKPDVINMDETFSMDREASINPILVSGYNHPFQFADDFLWYPELLDSSGHGIKDINLYLDYFPIQVSNPLGVSYGGSLKTDYFGKGIGSSSLRACENPVHIVNNGYNSEVESGPFRVYDFAYSEWFDQGTPLYEYSNWYTQICIQRL